MWLCFHWNVFKYVVVFTCLIIHRAELTQAELTQGRLDSGADLTSGRLDPLPLCFNWNVFDILIQYKWCLIIS